MRRAIVAGVAVIACGPGPSTSAPASPLTATTAPIACHAVIFDESEGQIGWSIGCDGSGCISLAREGGDVMSSVAAG